MARSLFLLAPARFHEKRGPGGGTRTRLVALAALLALPLTAQASPPPWPGFQVIEWQPRTEAALAALRGIGVTAGMVPAEREGDPAAVAERAKRLLSAGLRVYVESIATDFYAAYHRWTPGKPVNWRFCEAQLALQSEPDSLLPLIRRPSLSDPAWRARIAARVAAHANAMRDADPLYYSLADEAGIADLSAFWDFDFSPAALAAFRDWLRREYGSLESLSAEWGASFATWDDVMPWTTRQAIRAPAGNAAPWADFKAFMDQSFAQAVREGADALHRADPLARAALEGGQVPGWGGYDYALLAPALDVMETYDPGETTFLLRAFNPSLIPLATSFKADAPGLHAIWRGWLHGVRGLVLWDEDESIVAADGRLGARGKAYAPVFAALQGETAERFAAGVPDESATAILYSPASFRLQWLRENRRAGDGWMRGGAERDSQGVATREAFRAYLGTLRHLGVLPRVLTDAALAAQGPPRVRVIFLPHAVALSDGALAALRRFAAAGGVIVADGPFGQADQHGRTRGPGETPALRAAPGDRTAVRAALARAAAMPDFALDRGDVEIAAVRANGNLLLALQRDFSARGAAEPVTLTLRRGLRARDPETGRWLPGGAHVTLTLDPVAPAIVELVRAD